MVDLLAIQINSSADIQSNLQKIERQLEQVRSNTASPALAVLPECASLFGCDGKAMLADAEALGEGKIQSAYSEFAQRFNLYLVAGSTPIAPKDAEKYYAASLVYSPEGKCISQYNKIHLFDVEVEDNTRSYFESKYTLAGEHLNGFHPRGVKSVNRFVTIFALQVCIRRLCQPILWWCQVHLRKLLGKRTGMAY